MDGFSEGERRKTVACGYRTHTLTEPITLRGASWGTVDHRQVQASASEESGLTGSRQPFPSPCDTASRSGIPCKNHRLARQ